ncbi:MAG: hypothetical protein Q7R99_01585 [bacterium]|nr:hypothetical protein [bacterium]
MQAIEVRYSELVLDFDTTKEIYCLKLKQVSTKKYSPDLILFKTLIGSQDLGVVVAFAVGFRDGYGSGYPIVASQEFIKKNAYFARAFFEGKATSALKITIWPDTADKA